jgi:uncharacterized protein YfdQ (DUF2303 family)
MSYEEDKQRPDASIIEEVTRQAAAVREVQPSKNYVVVDTDGNATILDLEKLRERPDRTRGIYRPSDVASFTAYLKEHQIDGETTVWVHPTEGSILAIVDDSDGDPQAPGWREHKVLLVLEHSQEWLYWEKQDGEMMGQEEFAEFLREGLPDIGKPDGAQLLEIADTFQATTSAQFRSQIDRTSSAVKFAYDETVDATAVNGEVEIPKQFTLMLAPFLGEEKVEITANLKYKVAGGNLRLGYKLERPEREVEASLERIADQLGKEFPRTYRGTPA